jgi:dipeptidyl aminopeptidase/acylaminoacyl peptidase
MKRNVTIVLLALIFATQINAQARKPLAIEELLTAPFPENMTAAKSGNRIAWTFNQTGKRNVWVAEGPDFKARPLTPYREDDGQEISDVHFSYDGNTIVYVRGQSKNPGGQYPNPTSDPAGVEQSVWSVEVSGTEPRKVDAGQSPAVSSKGTIAYLRDGKIWLAPLDASGKPKQLQVRGENESEEWSPDGSLLAFVSGRGDHSFIGVYDGKTVNFISPSIDSDSEPCWSEDGKRIAFVRRPAQPSDTPQGFFLEPDHPHPWAIWVADVVTGKAREIWRSSQAALGSFPNMADATGGAAIQWAADSHLLMVSEEDGWQHLYSLSADGGAPQLLTPGNCEVEWWSFTPDKTTVVFNSNCGDIDRRHLWSVELRGGRLRQQTGEEGSEGVEWSPVVLSDGQTVAYLGSNATHPARLFRTSLSAARRSTFELAADTWPKDFPAERLVVPQTVVFHATDGMEIHAQLFLPRDLKAGQKRPALIFLHGGSMRQMLLGWHYMYYYSNAYAMNQYLASRGYLVLAINYRSGIGYGRAFREAPGRAGRGATEYRDVVAAGKYLEGRDDVDPGRIGLWGGSYGGYLTAMGLGRNSDLFAAGVDFHGVHDWPTDNWAGKNISPELTKLARDSSPVTAVDTWKSPVLFIHGDDDRNVYFSQTVDLVARLRARGVAIEQLIFPDEVHDFLLHRNWLAAYHAASDFLDRHFHMPEK